MNKEDIAFRKLALLMKAVTEMNKQEDALEELKSAAFEVLLLNPGCEQEDWAHILIGQYGTELIDAYGTNPQDVHDALVKLWKSPYLDKCSGLEYDYHTWAQALCTDAAVQMYYDLTDTNHP